MGNKSCEDQSEKLAFTQKGTTKGHRQRHQWEPALVKQFSQEEVGMRKAK